MKKLLSIIGAIVAAGTATGPIISLAKDHQGSESKNEQQSKIQKDKKLIIEVGKIFLPEIKLSDEQRNERIISQVQNKLAENVTLKNTGIEVSKLAIMDYTNSSISFAITKESENVIWNYQIITNFILAHDGIDNGESNFEQTGIMQINLGTVWTTPEMNNEDFVIEMLENNRLFNMDNLSIVRKLSFDKNGTATYIAKSTSGKLWEVRVNFELNYHKDNTNPWAPAHKDDTDPFAPAHKDNTNPSAPWHKDDTDPFAPAHKNNDNPAATWHKNNDNPSAPWHKDDTDPFAPAHKDNTNPSAPWHKDNTNPSTPISYEFMNLDLGEIQRGPNGTDANAVWNTLNNNNKFKEMDAQDLTLNFMGQDHAIFSATVFDMGIHHYEITVNFKLVNLDIDNGTHSQAVDTIVLDLGTIFRSTDSDTTRIKKLVEGSREFKEQNVRITRISSFTTNHAEFMASNLEGHFVKISVSFELKFNDKNNDNPAMNKNEVSLSIDLGNIRRDGISTDMELINNALMADKTIKDLDLHDLVSIFRSAFQARYTATKLGFEITTYTIDVRYKLLDPAQTPDNGLVNIPTVATELSLGTIYKSPDQSVQEVVEDNVKNNSTIKDLGIISFINTSFDETLSSATFIGASIGTTYNITVTFDVVDNHVNPTNPSEVEKNNIDVNLGEIVVDKDQTTQDAVTKLFLASQEFNSVALGGQPTLTSFEDNKAVFTGYNLTTNNIIEVINFNVTFTIKHTTPTGDQTSTLNDAFAGHMYGDNIINATNSGITIEGTDDESIIAAFLQFGNLQDTFKVSDFKIIPANDKSNFNLKSQIRNSRFVITTSDTATFTISAPFNFDVRVNVYSLNDLFGVADGASVQQELSVNEAKNNMTSDEARINWAIDQLYKTGGDKVPAGLTADDFTIELYNDNLIDGFMSFGLVAKNDAPIVGRQNFSISVETHSLNEILGLNDGDAYNVDLSLTEVNAITYDHETIKQWVIDLLVEKGGDKVPAGLTADDFDIVVDYDGMQYGQLKFRIIANGVIGLKGQAHFAFSWNVN